MKRTTMLAGIALFMLSACDEMQELSDDVELRFGDYTPLDMAECAGFHIALSMPRAEVEIVATREATGEVYGWSQTEADEEIEKWREIYAERLALEMEIQDRVFTQCGDLLPLMHRLYDRRTSIE